VAAAHAKDTDIDFPESSRLSICTVRTVYCR